MTASAMGGRSRWRTAAVDEVTNRICKLRGIQIGTQKWNRQDCEAIKLTNSKTSSQDNLGVVSEVRMVQTVRCWYHQK